MGESIPKMTEIWKDADGRGCDESGEGVDVALGHHSWQFAGRLATRPAFKQLSRYLIGS
jgi:hypothetical protein